MKPVFIISCIAFLLTATAFSQTKKPVAKKKVSTAKKAPMSKKIQAEPMVKIITDSGTIIVRLYDKTPQHRDNFLRLVGEHFYDSLMFHRVIKGFMIQGGDPQSKNAMKGGMLGSGDVGYTIPAEFDTSLFHKAGALAAARDNNPTKASSGCQFYIVQGKKYTDEELNMMEMQSGQKFSAAKRTVYKSKGGTPFLDMNYTVFGEVLEGMEVINKIAETTTNGSNRPLSDIRMKIVVMK